MMDDNDDDDDDFDDQMMMIVKIMKVKINTSVTMMVTNLSYLQP